MGQLFVGLGDGHRGRIVAGDVVAVVAGGLRCSLAVVFRPETSGGKETLCFSVVLFLWLTCAPGGDPLAGGVTLEDAVRGLEASLPSVG